MIPDTTFNIQNAVAVDSLYDGITPEVIENKGTARSGEVKTHPNRPIMQSE